MEFRTNPVEMKKTLFRYRHRGIMWLHWDHSAWCDDNHIVITYYLVVVLNARRFVRRLRVPVKTRWTKLYYYCCILFLQSLPFGSEHQNEHCRSTMAIFVVFTVFILLDQCVFHRLYSVYVLHDVLC